MNRTFVFLLRHTIILSIFKDTTLFLALHLASLMILNAALIFETMYSIDGEVINRDYQKGGCYYDNDF